MRHSEPADAGGHRAAVVAVRDERCELDAREDKAVDAALAAGVSFAALGRVFGISRQAARDRWSHRPEAASAADGGPRHREPDDAEKYLTRVRKICAERAELDARERSVVHAAVEAGLSYAELGRIYGVKRQTARQKWAPPERNPSAPTGAKRVKRGVGAAAVRNGETVTPLADRRSAGSRTTPRS